MQADTDMADSATAEKAEGATDVRPKLQRQCIDELAAAVPSACGDDRLGPCRTSYPWMGLPSRRQT